MNRCGFFPTAHRSRRILASLRGLSWGSVWGMTGNVFDLRCKLLSGQMEILGPVRKALEIPGFS
ncbi:MAG: hypothetical protein ABSF78_04670 [Candidatus Acidiferrales bacterium]